MRGSLRYCAPRQLPIVTYPALDPPSTTFLLAAVIGVGPAWHHGGIETEPRSQRRKVPLQQLCRCNATTQSTRSDAASALRNDEHLSAGALAEGIVGIRYGIEGKPRPHLAYNARAPHRSR